MVFDGVVLEHVADVVVVLTELDGVLRVVLRQETSEIHTIPGTTDVLVRRQSAERDRYGERLTDFFVNDLHWFISVQLLIKVSCSDRLRRKNFTEQTFLTESEAGELGGCVSSFLDLAGAKFLEEVAIHYCGIDFFHGNL
jgi:hypothetical protein